MATLNETTFEPTQPNAVPGQEYTSTQGVRVTKINGQEYLNLQDVQMCIAMEISRLPKEMRPNVLAAQDARKVINELMDGLGGAMEKFREDSKKFLEDLRQTRTYVIVETTSVLNPLKDLRQFFLGSDYKEQIARLKEFVELCERLKALKDSGFLDKVADTMLKLA